MDQQLADLQRQLEESKAQIAKEQKQREEEQKRREVAEAHAKQSQHLRAEEQKRREVAEAHAKQSQHLRAEEQKRREEEQSRREVAEAHAKQSQPKNLIDYLRACHNFSLSLQVVTDETLTTKGDTTKPAGRLYPQRIIPWNDFPQQQETCWEDLSIRPSFTSQQVYPSSHQLEYVQKYLDPVSSELGLRHHARDTVENPVRTVIGEIYKHEELRKRLQLGGTLMFESHTNLGNTNDNPIEEEVEHMSISGSHTSKAERQKKKGKDITRGNNRGITGTADQFCIYELADGRRVPAVLIEYKAPHKLPLAEIIAGLSGEIRPAEDVINKDGDELEFLSKSLLAAVITQLFSSMIGKGVQRGYIFTGEAIIFLYIPDDPTTVQYHLSIPSLDVQDSDRNRLHRTAVAQITAFILNAFAAEPPSQSWHDAAAYLDTWAVEYIDILKKIPETVRKAPRHSSYRPSNWKGFTRSPIRTRAQTRHLASACRDNVDDQVHSSSDEDNDNEDPPSPTPNKTDRAVKQGRTTSAQPGARSGFGRKSANEQDNIEVTSKPRIEDRPYCTHQCLLGLASGGVLDHSCPNLTDHSGQHLQQEHFLRLVRVQLANDRGRDADCKPLFVKGSRGALVKIRLSSHGYTFVAKAMRADDRQHLLNEAKIYSRLKTLQGHHVPVYLGILDLELPIYYDYGIYVSMLLLSWAGRSLHLHLNQDNATRVLESVSETLTALHKRRVLHKDPELRNWLWDEQRGSIMLIDFERASVRDRPPLNVLSPNRKRNRQGELKGVGEDDAFDREMQIARNCVARYTR